MTTFSDSGDPNWLTATDIDARIGKVVIGRQILEVVRAFGSIGYVAGGAARYMMVEDAPEPRDIDVFMFRHEFDIEPLFRLGYVTEGKPDRAPFFQLPSILVGEGGHERLRVQVIRPDGDCIGRRSFGPPLAVLNEFTYHTEQAALYASGTTRLITGLISVEGLRTTRERIITNNHIANPVLSLFRLNKYGQKGFGVSMETLLQLTDTLRAMSAVNYDDIVREAMSVES